MLVKVEMGSSLLPHLNACVKGEDILLRVSNSNDVRTFLYAQYVTLVPTQLCGDKNISILTIF